MQRLGGAVAARWGGDLPFLLKVLSVGKALSIQAHPDLALAARLFREQPGVYKARRAASACARSFRAPSSDTFGHVPPPPTQDGNHKPEMVLPLTPFEARAARAAARLAAARSRAAPQALVGFVTPSELAASIASVPELAELVGADACAAVAASAGAAPGDAQAAASLRAAFGAAMRAPSDMAAAATDRLAARLASEASVAPLSGREALALRLSSQYPSDVGVLASYFLNYLALAPGAAVALAANEPHAYLAGECIEVMATSDNVVRAGLTPKLRDVPTLTSMLTYSQAPPTVYAGVAAAPPPHAAGGPPPGTVRAYGPPFDEFALDALELGAGGTLSLPPLAGPAVLLVTEGEGSAMAAAAGGGEPQEGRLRPGGAFFVTPGTTLTLQDGGAGLKAFRARVSDAVFSS